MKPLISIFAFLLLSISLFAQDTTKTNYKNQIGYDGKSVVNAFAGERGVLNEIDFLYRRQINEKSWCMAKLSYIAFSPVSHSNTFYFSESYIQNDYLSFEC